MRVPDITRPEYRMLREMSGGVNAIIDAIVAEDIDVPEACAADRATTRSAPDDQQQVT